jgi:hypothetical protein
MTTSACGGQSLDGPGRRGAGPVAALSPDMGSFVPVTPRAAWRSLRGRRSRPEAARRCPAPVG